MTSKSLIKSWLAAIVASSWLILVPPVYSSEILKKAIREYNRGNYPIAIGLFGQAESTEFNNPLLHYYLANALAKTNQKTDAIKEYKVALAMAPQGQMAEYCRQGLNALGVVSDEAGAVKKPATARGAVVFTYVFDARGNPTDIRGKISPNGSFRLHRVADGIWSLKEIKNAKDLIISTIPIAVRNDGRIIGSFNVNSKGDLIYIGPERVKHVIHSDGSVEDQIYPRVRATSSTGRSPEVVVNLCGCHFCHRIELIVVDLRRRYGDRVAFSVSSSDTRTASADCPKVQFIESNGRPLFVETGYIPEKTLYQNMEKLLSESGSEQAATASDRHVEALAVTITQEAEVRIAQNQVQLTRQIQQIREEERLSLMEDRNHRFDSAARETAERRIQFLRQDFERKQKEIRAAAKARIEALTGGPGGYGVQTIDDAR